MRLHRVGLIALFAIVRGASLGAQTVSADSAEGARLFAARKWAEAATVYARVTRADSTRTGAWMRLGTALDSVGRHADALRAYEGARRAGGPVGQILFQLARTHASLGSSDRASAYLDSAATNGFSGFDALKAAPELAKIRSTAGYASALARVEQNRYPCRTSPEARQFDFWVGNWSVQISGTEVGTNRIEHAIDRCAILENWETPGGPNGKSLNYWDPTLRKWKQIFIFDIGRVSDYTGEWTGGEMRFLAAPAAVPNGGTAINRMTFFPIARDTVRQLIEVSRDGGKTWTSGFDALYIRRPASR
jgi:hypothetical protein